MNTGNLVRHHAHDHDALVYNNTGYNVLVFNDTPNGYTGQGSIRWNNVIVVSLDNDFWFSDPARPLISDYNVWSAGQGFTFNNDGYANLAAVKAAPELGTLEDNSTDTACQFVNAPTDLHIVAATMCKTFGRIRSGGVFTSTPTEVGAYGVTSCVGHTCS